MSYRTAIAALLGGVIGGGCVWFFQTGNLSLQPGRLSYADLAATLLAASALVIAIFGGVLALAAVWGFAQLKREAVGAAVLAGTSEVREQIENGPLRAYILSEIERMTRAEIGSPRTTQLIKERVDAVAFGQPDKDSLLEGDE